MAPARQQRLLSVDDWVRRINTLARQIETYAASVHPGALIGDAYFQGLVQRYRVLAAAATRDHEKQQPDLGDE
jgi:hypothetical protein